MGTARLTHFILASGFVAFAATNPPEYSPPIINKIDTPATVQPLSRQIGKDTLLPRAYYHCDSTKYGALVMDGTSGEVILSHNAHKKLYPASMVKMMTTLLALEKLENGTWQENTVLKAQTVQSTTQGLVKLNLKANQPITVKDAMLGTFIVSAADAAQTLAVGVAGSAKNFVEQMNQKADELGMCHTYFMNTSGDKDNTYGLCQNAQISTPYDMALLMQALWQKGQKYPHLLTPPNVVFGKKANGQPKSYKNHALLPELKQVGMTVGKTGCFKEAGCNIATLFNDNKIVVLYGAYSNWDRSKHVRELKIIADNLVSKTSQPNTTQTNQKKFYNTQPFLTQLFHQTHRARNSL